jgi:hypothetical protein
VEQRPRLIDAELQIGGPDLGQLPLQPPPVQAQPYFPPGDEHEPQIRRCAYQHQLQLSQRLGRAQLVHIVDHEPERILHRHQIF